MDNISIYEPRTMLEVVKRMPKCHTFLLDTFFKQVETTTTKKVDIDIKRGNRRLAPFVHDVQGGEVVPNTGYVTATYEPLLVSPICLTTASDITARMPGESIYNSMSPEQRAVKKMGEELENLNEMITRREEYMAAQALTTGTIHVKGKGIDQLIDFGLTNKEVITEAIKKWSDVENSNPISDIQRWHRNVQIKGFVNPDILILGYKATEYLLANKNIQSALDVENIGLAKIAPEVLPNGATYVGYIKLLGVSIYQYNEYYLDDFTNPEEATTKPMIPDNLAILASTASKYKRAYGGVPIVDDNNRVITIAEGTRIPEYYVERNPSRQFIQLSSKPLPIPCEIDSWYSAQVCDAE